MESINFNVGILGHVDSGKTSLARALSTTASTAAFDKNPQSRERGITLDLGFSTFEWAVDDVMRADNEALHPFSTVQVTLVDCPGHASLIRTVIGGAQIIDLVLLVIDASKGMQTQTAECLILAEITCPSHMILVLNKCDLVAETALEKMRKRVRKTLDQSFPNFSSCPMVEVSAAVGGDNSSTGLDKLTASMQRAFYVPARHVDRPFVMAVDHCFVIKGQGTVMTGTALAGRIKVGQDVVVPLLNETRKIKSIQRFRRSVESISAGERAGICVPALDATALERCLICDATQPLKPLHAALASLEIVRFFKKPIDGKTRYHVSIGHDTVMARITLFEVNGDTFDWSRDHMWLPEVSHERMKSADGDATCEIVACLMEFDRPVFCQERCIYIASRLDADVHTNQCRIAFHGRLLHSFHSKSYAATELPNLRLYKNKLKIGVIERMHDESTVIVRGLVKKETKVELFAGLKVNLSTGEHGVIESSFGQSGKLRVRVPAGLQPSTIERLPVAGKKNKTAAAGGDKMEQIRIELAFKRFIFDAAKKMIQ